MSLFRVFVDGQLFYHPHLSQLSITEAKVQEEKDKLEKYTQMLEQVKERMAGLVK